MEILLDIISDLTICVDILKLLMKRGKGGNLPLSLIGMVMACRKDSLKGYVSQYLSNRILSINNNGNSPYKSIVLIAVCMDVCVILCDD